MWISKGAYQRPVVLFRGPAFIRRNMVYEKNQLVTGVIIESYYTKNVHKILEIPAKEKQRLLHRCFQEFCLHFKQFVVVVSSSQNDYIREGLWNGCFHSNERSKKLQMNQLQINHQFRKGTLNPASIYLLKVNHRNSRKRYEICSKLTMKTPKRFH